MLKQNGPVPRVKKLFSSFQARLLAVFLITTLLTVVIVVFFNQWLRVQLIAEADNALLISATQIAGRIDEFHRSNQQVFNVGSRLPYFVDFLQADEDQRADGDLRMQARITLDLLDIEPWDQYHILSQSLFDRDGRNVLDTLLADIGTNEAQQDYFRAALLGGSINISPIQYRPERSGVYFYYAVPLRAEAPSFSIIGVLRIQVAIGSIQNIVFESVRGQDFDAAIFDQNFVRVADTQHEKLLFRSITEFTPEQITALRSQYALPPLPDDEVSMPLPDLVADLANTHQAQIISGYTTPDSDREERIAVVKLETVPWYLVLSQPTEQHYQTVRQQTTGILVLAIALTVVAFVSSYLISRRITEPIRTLTTVAEQVADGTLHIKAPVTSNDEVGTLARTFNLMTTELEQAHATLEERVVHRTLALSAANKQLKHEIVERQRYEKQALELAFEHERRRILSEFIQKASHEFKTPLSIVSINSYLVKRLLPDEKRGYMDAIEEQGKYIEGLVNRMVLMSRLDSGIADSTEYLQIDEFVRTVYTSKAAVFEERHAIIHLDLQSADTGIYANSELLFIAIQNILDNALKHSDEPVEIFIRTRVLNGAVAISIEDTGIGISQDLQERVFERFFRVDEAHSTRGFGLGLPITKRIVENFGGTVELESQVGKGTTVTIKLGI